VFPSNVTWLEDEANSRTIVEIDNDDNVDMTIVLHGVGHNLQSSDFLFGFA
jgi:hypothetical protein